MLIVSVRPYELAQLAAARTSPRLVALQPMAYLFIEGNEAKFCDRADLVAGTSVLPGAEGIPF